MTTSNYKVNEAFWHSLDQLVRTSEIIIDRPQGSTHPRYPGLVYPMDYGYLKNTTSSDGDGIDIWIGKAQSNRVDAVMCIVDMQKRDSEIKVLYSCSEDEMNTIYAIHNGQGMNGVLLKR